MKRRSRINRLLLTTSALAIAAGFAGEAEAACTAIANSPSANNPNNGTLICVNLPSNVGTGFVNNGTIGSPATHTAVQITANTLSGSFVNNGLIEGTLGAFGNGISISAGGRFTAGINNAGTILGTGTATGHGIIITAPSFGGGISSSGSIHASGDNFATDIRLTGASFSGGVSNSGSLTASGDSARGINVAVSNFSGGVQNAGSIGVTGDAATGIRVTGSTFSGGVINTANGTINASASNSGGAFGINVFGVQTFSGGVSNAGHIGATQTDSGRAFGINVSSVSTFSGGVTNSGSIHASAISANAFGVNVANVSTFSGGIVNSAGATINVTTAKGNAFGILVAAAGTDGGTDIFATFSGGISNAGSISAHATAGKAFGIAVLANHTGSPGSSIFSTFSGGITNSGGITVSVTSGSTGTGQAIGIFVGTHAALGGVTHFETFSGGIVNSGSIGATGGVNPTLGTGNGIGILVSDISTFSGGIVNTSTGTIIANSFGADEFAAGIDARFMSSFSGGISNAGSIGAFASGSAFGIVAHHITTFSGGIQSSGQITVSGTHGSAVGIYAHDILTFSGGISNSGSISATGHSDSFVAGIFASFISTFSGGIQNSGSIGVTPGSGGFGAGIEALFISTFSGGISNSGSIHVASSHNTAVGIYATEITTFSGGIQNSGSITVTAFEDSAIGISAIFISTFSGGITNSGLISATATGSTAVGIRAKAISTFSGGILNSGTITVRVNGDAANAFGMAIGPTTGYDGNISTFSGGVSNSGVLTVSTFSGTAFGIFVGGRNTNGHSSFTGIRTFSGGITNSGTISATSTDGTAFGIVAGGLSGHTDEFTGISTFSGGIVNTSTGTITATSSFGDAFGIMAGGLASFDEFESTGISTFSGGISNAGLISATAHSGNAFGIFVGGASAGFEAFAGIGTFSGGIANSGTIIANAGPSLALLGAQAAGIIDTGNNAFGIFVGGIGSDESFTFNGVRSFGGGISNSGEIHATASGGNAVGIFVGGVGTAGRSSLAGVSTFSGGISNSGLITAHSTGSGKVAAGILVGGLNTGYGFEGVPTFSGGISNSGTIQATSTRGNAFGILVGNTDTCCGPHNVTTFSGGISNSGTVMATASSGNQAVGMGVIRVATFSGGIGNSGFIQAISHGFEGVAYGIYVYGVTTFSGGIQNTSNGVIHAFQTDFGIAAGIRVDHVSTFSGGIQNAGSIGAGGTTDGYAKTGIGIDVRHVTTFSGGISNSGTISVGYATNTAVGINIHSVSTFSGGINNSGYIDVTATGIGSHAIGVNIDPTIFSGGFTNSGDIEVSANHGATGLFATASTFDGGISNSGTIHAVSGGEGNVYGIRLQTISQYNGGINNSGTILAENHFNGHTPIKAYGIYIDVSTFNGGITNSGTIQAFTSQTDIKKIAGQSGIGIFTTSAVIGTITNTGTIEGTNWAIDISQSQGQNTINTSAGKLLGGINLSNTFTDTVNISGGVVEASILGAEGVVNQTGGILTVPIDRTFFEAPPNTDTRDLSKFKSVGTVGTPISKFLTSGGVINFDIDGTPSVPLTGVATNTLAGGGTEVRNGFIIAQTVSLGAGTGYTINPMPDLYLNGTVYHQVINGVASFTDSHVLPAPVGISLGSPSRSDVPPIVVPNTLLLSATITTDTCIAVPNCVGSPVGSEQINLSVRNFENPNAPGVGLTPNEIQAGIGLDFLAHSPNGLLAFGTSVPLSLGGLFLFTDPTKYQTALDQLGGYQIAQGFNLSMGIPIYTGGMIQTLLASGPNRGGMAQSAMLSNSGIQIASAGKIVTDADSPTQVAQGPVGPSASPWTFWGRGYGVWGDADNQRSPNHVAGYNETRGGGIFGADYTFNDNWLLGGIVNYSHNSIDFKQSAGNTDLDNLLFGVYGQYRSGPWYINGTFQGGWDWYKTNRNIFIPIVATAHSNYDGQTYGAYAEGGWDFLLERWKLTPFIGIGWVHGHIDPFTESGAGPADLAVHDSNADSIQSSLGARLSTRVPLWGSFLVPEVRAAWQHEFGDQAHTINNSFALSPSGVFTQQGTVFGREGGVFGASLTYDVRSNLKVFADFDYKVMTSYSAEAVLAGLKFNFGQPAPLPPPQPAPAAQPVPPPPAAAHLFVVYFNFDKYDLTPDGQRVVDEAIASFKQTGSAQIKVDGYTDLAGTQAYNLGLSKKRADTVRAALVRGGVPANVIVEAWHGKENPAVPTADGVREARNRRVELLLP